MDTQYKLELAEAIMESDMSNNDKYQMLQVIKYAQLDEAGQGATAAGMIGVAALITVIDRWGTQCRRRCALLVGPRRGACLQGCQVSKLKKKIQVYQTTGMQKCQTARDPITCRQKVQNKISKLEDDLRKSERAYKQGLGDI